MPHDSSAIAQTIRNSGRRLTVQRARVLAALHDLPGHSTAEQIHAHATTRGVAEMALSTVYRNLDALVEMGLVAAFPADGVTAYEWAAGGGHHHLRCDDCGHTAEVGLASLDAVRREVEHTHGFTVDIRHLAIHGQCRGCHEQGDRT